MFYFRFLRLACASVIVFTSLSSFAYRTQGFESINPDKTLKLATKAGLTISSEERSIKHGLVKLKKHHGKELDKKIQEGDDNPDYYQGYLLEIKDGLKKVEKAKNIAKYQIYKQVQKSWGDLKKTGLNVNVDKSFKKFRYTLVRDLNEKIAYVGDKEVPATKDAEAIQGYRFEMGQWGYVTVSDSLKNITWKIAFNYDADDNELQKGALDIKIDSDSGSSDSDELKLDDKQK